MSDNFWDGFDNVVRPAQYVGWRSRREWHLGWAPHEVEWMRAGVPFPETWDWHRAGTIFEGVTYRTARQCAWLGHPGIEPMIWRTDYGRRMVWMTCPDCGHREGSPLGKKKLKEMGRSMDELRIANSGAESVEECERCGSGEDVQYHHWAPRHLFGREEADRWPGSYLCQPCHATWHRIVTPNMNRKTA